MPVAFARGEVGSRPVAGVVAPSSTLRSVGNGLSRRATLAGVAVLATSGCGLQAVNFGPESAEPTATTTKDPALVADREFFLRSREGSAKRLVAGKPVEQRVSTPHLDFMLRSCFTGDRLDAETMTQVGQEEASKAPDGYELAAFTLQGGVPGFLLTADDVLTTRLVIGDKTVAVPNLFDKFNSSTGRYLNEWEMFVLCVPTGAPVLLEVVDAGKTVTVDLRTGVPVVDEAWKANTGFRERWKITCEPATGVFSRKFTTMPPAELEPVTATLEVGLKPNTLSGLLPWIPTLGWAADGSQWLAVPMAPKVVVPEGNVFPQMNINVASSFQYQDQSGVKHAAFSPKTVTTEAIARQQVDLIVIWAVSGRDGEAVLTFNPTGPIEVDFTNHPNMPAQFTSAVEPLDFTLTFAPAP